MNDKGAARAPFLRVMAPNVADVVRSAGGLVFDRVRQGWRVTVVVPGDDDTRALRVLGVDVGDPSTRDEFDAALATKSAEVILWGSAKNLDSNSAVASHRLSRAAQVFKVHALIAAGLTPSVEPTETFWTSCASSAWADPAELALVTEVNSGMIGACVGQS
jgi:hypothetical protein